MFKNIHIQKLILACAIRRWLFAPQLLLIFSCGFLAGCIPLTCASYRVPIAEERGIQETLDTIGLVFLKLGYAKGTVWEKSLPDRLAERVWEFKSEVVNGYDLVVVLNKSADKFLTANFCEKSLSFSEAALKERDLIFNALQMKLHQ